ncbi:MAG: hypothetical protein MUF73_18975 [Rhodobacteraceae bacterium]|nr:hypothetical protein [Paracoccaceae bacterium]
MTTTRKKPTDWRKRFAAAKAPHTVMLHTDFAGVRAGTHMLISSPGDIANYLSRIPRGETRTIERMRNEMARKAGAGAMCPVTAAIYLRVVAEVALRDWPRSRCATLRTESPWIRWCRSGGWCCPAARLPQN